MSCRSSSPSKGMDYPEGSSASTPGLARYNRQPLLPTSDDYNLQCNDYEIESNNMISSSKSAQGDEIPKVKEELEGGGKGSGNEISDESVNQEDDEAEENGDEATEVADMFLKRKRYTSLRTTTKKAKGAIAYPIPELKMKADLLEEFGDPAVVDQLLVDLDGDVSPGGTRRLRRCRNAEGAIEYWLEDADLVNIRKEAVVNDPYCVPSPGWRPEDCPTEHISILKREVELIAKTLEEFKKEVRALMEENLSMFSALFSEIKKKFLLEKEDEKQGMQGVVRKKEEEERSSDAQYEARDNNNSTGYKTATIMVHDSISGDISRNKKVKEYQELPSKTSGTYLSEGAD